MNEILLAECPLDERTDDHTHTDDEWGFYYPLLEEE